MKKQGRFLLLLSFLVMVLLAGSYLAIELMGEDSKRSSLENEELRPNIPEVEEIFLSVPPSKNGLMIGFDQSNRLTDVLMLGHVDTEENKIKVISIPRDFFIDFSKEPFKSIKKANPKNKIGHCKINEIYINMGSSDEGLEVLKQVIEAITGLEIDYLATINVNGFKEVVDIVGGVEFDVPERMYKVDPYQDPPLKIDLHPGLQLLNGEQAQGLVRFRGYRLGDIQRIKVQQDFVTALFKKVTSSNTEQMTELVKQIFRMFKADFGLVEMMDYLNYFLDKDMNQIMSTTNMITLEGYPGDVNGASVLYFELDKNRQLVEELLKKQVEKEEMPTDSADKESKE